MTGLTAVSLFSGIGGVDLALVRAGIRVVAAVEIDPDCRNVLRRHFPDVTIFDDVQEVTGDELRAVGFVPQRGLLSAGWPCQGNSVAGRRGGMADPRSGLWQHVVRLIRETSPAWFLGENVPGLYSVNDAADIAVVRRDLAQHGYWWTERILDAQYFGVPQRRARVFFVGSARNRRAPVEVLLDTESSIRDSAPGRASRPDTSAAADDSADDARRIVNALTAAAGRGASSGNLAEDGHLTISTLQGGGRRGHRLDVESAAGGHLIPFDTRQITHRENRSNPHPGDPAPTLNQSGTVHVSLGSAGDFSSGVDVAQAIRAAHAQPGNVSDGITIRRLTPRECERLQGFPDDWTAGQPDSTRYRQLGNAVAVPVAEWIAHRIAHVNEQESAA